MSDLGVSHEARRRAARRKRLCEIANDASVFIASPAGAVARKILPDATAGGETIRPLTWGALLSAIVVGVLVVALREWYGKEINHAVRRKHLWKRLIEALVIGYLGADLLPYLLQALQGAV